MTIETLLSGTLPNFVLWIGELRGGLTRRVILSLFLHHIRGKGRTMSWLISSLGKFIFNCKLKAENEES